MIHQYSRKLDNLDLIEHFLSVGLNYENPSDTELLNKIKSGEAELKNYDDSSSTLNNTSHRDRKYLNKETRWGLRKQIVDELMKFKREDEDENIKLENGGALPNTVLKREKKAIIIIGLPASGKSGIADIIADQYGAVILDSDYAKRKLPEFKDNPAGASLVHEESDILIFGYNGSDKPDDFKSVFEICYQDSLNIVVPKIGHNHKSINDLAKGFKMFGYDVHLVLVSLDRKKATIRAINRFYTTGRYVPLSLIFDGYGNDPTLSFYRLKDKIFDKDDNINSFGKISTDVEKGSNPIVLFADEGSPACLFK